MNWNSAVGLRLIASWIAHYSTVRKRRPWNLICRADVLGQILGDRRLVVDDNDLDHAYVPLAFFRWRMLNGAHF